MNSVPVAPPITEYLYRKATAAGVPLSGTFELTPHCNMSCKMCYIHKTGEGMQSLRTPDFWLDLGRQARDGGMLYLLLTGGEPFLYPGFRQVLEGLQKMGLLISVNSNGTLIDGETVAWLKKCPPTRINISLYGASDETYARLCGNPKGFTQVQEAIRLLKEAGISVKLNCSLTPENGADLPKMVEFAKKNDLVFQVATYMFPPVRRDSAMTGQNHRFSPEEAAYYMAYADYLTLGEEKFLAQEEIPLPQPDEACAEVGDGIRCRAGRCSFWVTWQGNMIPCGMFPGESSPDLREQTFEKAWEAVKRFTAGIRLPGACADCPTRDHCRACAAMVITESGCFEKVPRYRCDMMGAYPGQRRRVKEEILWKKENSAEY